jgi:hypothetical protein
MSRSIEERVNTSLRVLSVIAWALQVQGPDNAELTSDQLCGCGEILDRVVADLEPIRTAPAAVLNWQPPTPKAAS